jgi:hypothetical protein
MSCRQFRDNNGFQHFQLHGRVHARVNLCRLHVGVPEPERHLGKLVKSYIEMRRTCGFAFESEGTCLKGFAAFWLLPKFSTAWVG